MSLIYFYKGQRFIEVYNWKGQVTVTMNQKDYTAPFKSSEQEVVTMIITVFGLDNLLKVMRPRGNAAKFFNPGSLPPKSKFLQPQCTTASRSTNPMSLMPSYRPDGWESACSAGDSGSIPGSRGFPGEGDGNPLPYSWLESFMDRGAWWATVYGVAKSWTRPSA